MPAPEGYRLRPFEPTDLDAVCEAEVRAVAVHDYPDLDPADLRARWRAYLVDGLGLTGTLRQGMRLDVLVDPQGAWAGHVLLLERPEPVLQDRILIVGMLVIRENLRGLGLGTYLMRHAEAVARSRSIPKLSLGVRPTNRAKRLYERLGYIPERVQMTRGTPGEPG